MQATSCRPYAYSTSLHAKPTISQYHPSVIATPAYSNADSGHVHTYERHIAPQTYGSPHRIILLAPSRPLIDASITISTPIHAGSHPTTTLESLPSSVCHLRFTLNSVGKRTEEKTLRSAIVVCPTIDELEVEGEGETAQVKTKKEELDERFSLPKRERTQSTSSTLSHSGHSIVVSDRARAARLANACPALQRVVFPNGV
ncbi:hypothetical protein EV421DRAFT_1910498 [Armillaria borealis]|uniref:Uncharacterized protein n=1 Tax=Armillaria borealis TaxID=47425 RepID=A0AA39J0E0_9AGAR|nr:hypothetical protein EV421DRAFT_1910498 [Armillaria borealis]